MDELKRYGLSTRLRNCLANGLAGQAVTPRAVAAKGYAYWIRYPNFGRQCMRELQAWLATYDLKLNPGDDR